MGRKQKETTESERKIILELHKKSKSYAEIAEIVKRSRFTVASIVRRYKGSSDVTSFPRTGRPRKLTAREETNIIRKIKKNPKTTSTELAAECLEELGKEIHPKTVRRTLQLAGYSSRIARKKPLISKVNKTKRLNFAKEYINKTEDFWDGVLFSDESKFNIFQSDGRIRVWRKPNTELEKNNVVRTVKHGGGGVMVWGCMAASGVGNLVFIDGTMDKTVYLNILKENLLQSVEKLGLGDRFYFQQDNDPKHTANIVRMWIIHHVPHILPTPPQSPDMNPIEHLWDELGRRVQKRHITSKTQLKEVLLQEWQNIGADVTKKLVHSMPRRLKEVISKKGYSTKY